MDQQQETAVLARAEAMIELSGSLGDGFALRSPVSARLWCEGDAFVADVDDLHVYSFGSTRDEAIENLRIQIVEQYLRFEELGDRLSPPAQLLARRFRDLVKRTDA